MNSEDKSEKEVLDAFAKICGRTCPQSNDIDDYFSEPDDMSSWCEFVKAAGLREGTIEDLLDVDIDDYGK